MSQCRDPFLSSRRRFLAGATAGVGGLFLAGVIPEAAQASKQVDAAFDGLAAFVAPGDDPYSVQQGVTAPRPGGVAAQAGPVVIATLDHALPIVVGAVELAAPGSLGVAILLDGLAVARRPLAPFGPFSSAFSNLKFADKRAVLEQIDDLPVLKDSQIGYGGNALITLAGMGAWSEQQTFDPVTRTLRSRPPAWERSNYGGVSDGWPEFQGYFQGRTEVTA